MRRKQRVYIIDRLEARGSAGQVPTWQGGGTTGGGISEEKGEEAGDAFDGPPVLVAELGGKYLEDGHVMADRSGGGEIYYGEIYRRVCYGPQKGAAHLEYGYVMADRSGGCEIYRRACCGAQKGAAHLEYGRHWHAS